MIPLRWHVVVDNYTGLVMRRTDTARQSRLDQIMTSHGLNSRQVGSLIERNPDYVRRYRAGLQPMPEYLLRLLELELEHGRGRELIQSRVAG